MDNFTKLLLAKNGQLEQLLNERDALRYKLSCLGKEIEDEKKVQNKCSERISELEKILYILENYNDITKPKFLNALKNWATFGSIVTLLLAIFLSGLDFGTFTLMIMPSITLGFISAFLPGFVKDYLKATKKERKIKKSHSLEETNKEVKANQRVLEGSKTKEETITMQCTDIGNQIFAKDKKIEPLRNDINYISEQAQIAFSKIPEENERALNELFSKNKILRRMLKKEE